MPITVTLTKAELAFIVDVLEAKEYSVKVSSYLPSAAEEEELARMIALFARLYDNAGPTD